MAAPKYPTSEYSRKASDNAIQSDIYTTRFLITAGPFSSCSSDGITVCDEKFPYSDGIYIKKYKKRTIGETSGSI